MQLFGVHATLAKRKPILLVSIKMYLWKLSGNLILSSCWFIYYYYPYVMYNRHLPTNKIYEPDDGLEAETGSTMKHLCRIGILFALEMTSKKMKPISEFSPDFQSASGLELDGH